MATGQNDDFGTRWRAAQSRFTSTWMERLSIRFGPHIVGRFRGEREAYCGSTKECHGKGGSVEGGENQKQVSSPSHTPLEISLTDARFPLSHCIHLLLLFSNQRSGRLAPPKTETGQITN